MEFLKILRGVALLASVCAIAYVIAYVGGTMTLGH